MQTALNFNPGTYEAAMVFVASLQGELMDLEPEQLNRWVLQELSPNHNIPEREPRRKKMPFVLWNNLRIKNMEPEQVQKEAA